ncbi:xaa-Pro aminopeptidase ApepP [Coccinella septempunctata]|uniref:xaa-Pro aminopeptidase ApepP n=1 Tax=Coccinella septempunctata TaxID=41139 RepID=UPI001D066E86|nr:xaa-Pro aminopeptidase ApepP [Coccinella septempunctata]
MPPKPTGHLLKQLRELMVNNRYVKEPLQAYIIPSSDAHSSEYIAACDQYRAFISGFTGSAGTAVVTQDRACLWTDARYYLQASQQLDENWTLMKEGESSTPSISAWLSKNLPDGSNVGVDPRLFMLLKWNIVNRQLVSCGHKLVPVLTNLTSILWTDRPVRPSNKVFPLGIKYTGKTIAEKLEIIVRDMKEKNCTTLVISTLDDVAWTLNLRGSDIEYNPLFFAYLVIKRGQVAIFINLNQLSPEVNKHLTEEMGRFTFSVHPYEEIDEYLKQCEKEKVWFSDSINYHLNSLVPKHNQHIEISPTTLLKAVKNPTEVQGMRNAHIKDGAALCCYLAWLEENVPKGGVTEMSGAAKLEEFRKLQDDFMGLSFPTISSSGPNGAIIHYQPTKASDRPIMTDSLYLCDSGAQFKDGTTDVTRTVHFGTPTSHEMECFTRVLKGQLKLGNAIFPLKIKGNYLDSFARQFLWEVGLDYGHGTSHGIGSFLNVHEGPMGISWRPYPEDPGLEPNMFLSNEPGFYEDGNFGIRLEDIVQIVPASLPYNFNNRGFLTFETITLCPKQTKLIDIELITNEEIELLNDYHHRCREILGPVLQKQGQTQALNWLWKETIPMRKKKSY